MFFTKSQKKPDTFLKSGSVGPKHVLQRWDDLRENWMVETSSIPHWDFSTHQVKSFQKINVGYLLRSEDILGSGFRSFPPKKHMNEDTQNTLSAAFAQPLLCYSFYALRFCLLSCKPMQACPSLSLDWFHTRASRKFGETHVISGCDQNVWATTKP